MGGDPNAPGLNFNYRVTEDFVVPEFEPGNPPPGQVRTFVDPATGKFTAKDSQGNGVLDSGLGTVNTDFTLTGNGAAPTPLSVSFLPANIIKSGLMAQYRIFPSESPAALVDYSGNGRNATGTVGTSPTIIPLTGGLQCTGNGAVLLPPALNSALTIMVLCGFSNSQGGTWNSPVQGNGGGSLGNSVGLTLGGPIATESIVGNSNGLLTDGWWNGVGVISLVMNNPDTLYINNIPVFNKQVILSGAGVQTAGSYQLGGCTSGSGFGQTTYLTGQIYYVLFYNRLLSAAEIQQNVAAMKAEYQQRGLATTSFGSIAGDITGIYLQNGDSITGNLNGFPYALVPSLSVLNLGVASLTAAKALADESYRTVAFYRPNAGQNVVSVWLGTNDIFGGTSVAQAFQDFVACCSSARRAGYRVIAVTMLDRQGYSSQSQAFNTLIRGQWKTFADDLADMASYPVLGATGANANTTYFADGTHPTGGSENNIIIPELTRHVNRVYGNNDFSCANVYTSTAPAATAITAASESGVICTITSTLNPPVGSMVTIAGVTPSGYNGTWKVLSTSSTQFTFYNYVGSLGAGTIFGTAAIPTMLDSDVYIILAGSASTPNFTLQTSNGLTGQDVHLKNTSATSTWTITPFGNETIDGASSITLAPGAHVILQAVLTSASAGGNNWITV